MSLGYRVIQQDSGPVLLVVNVTADTCPQASWFRLASEETSGTTVSCVIR